MGSETVEVPHSMKIKILAIRTVLAAILGLGGYWIVLLIIGVVGRLSGPSSWIGEAAAKIYVYVSPLLFGVPLIGVLAFASFLCIPRFLPRLRLRDTR